MIRALRTSIRTCLLLLILLPLVPGIGLGLYAAVEERQRAVAGVQRDTLQLAQYFASEERTRFESTHQLLISLAQTSEVRDGDAARCSAFLAELLQRQPHYASLGLISLDGDLICSALPLSGPVNVADRAYFQRALQRRDFSVGDYQIGRVTGKPTINFGYPILDAAGQPQAVVFAARDLAWLSQRPSMASLPEGATLLVIDRHGTILARSPDQAGWAGQTLSEATLLKVMLAQQGEGVVEIAGQDGVRRLYAFAPLHTGPETGAYVSIGLPIDLAFAEANRLAMRNLVAAGVFGALALILAWLGSDLFLMRRIQALVSATRRLAAGDLSARAGLPHDAGELGYLAHAFDDMAAALEQRTNQLRAAEATSRLLIEGVKDYAIIMLDPDGQVVSWNAGAEQITGYPADEILGHHVARFFPTAAIQRGAPAHELQVALAEGRSADEGWRVRKDGSRFWASVIVTTVRDQEGRFRGFSTVMRDMTERRQAEERLRFLAEAGALVSASLDFEATLTSLANLTIPFLADYCVIDLIELDSTPRQVIVAHPDPAKAALLHDLRRRYPFDPDSPHPVPTALRTGRPVLLAEMTRAISQDISPSADYQSTFGILAARSCICVPLLARGHLLGTLLVVRAEASGRHYTEADLVLAEELAGRAALAVDNARLYQAAQAEIAERVRAEEELRASEARSRAMLAASPDFMLRLGGDGAILDCHASNSDMWLLSPAAILGKNVRDLMPPAFVETALQSIARTLATGAMQVFEFRQPLSSGLSDFEARLVVSGSDEVLAIVRDMTERKALERQLAHQAFHDPLTSLPNRALLMDRLDHALTRVARQRACTAVLFLDLDRFKVINDSLGHEVGDRLLMAVAQRLSRCIRPADTIARLGGDEFTILLEDTDLGAAVGVAERIGECLQPPFILAGHEVVVTASIGIALGTAGQDTPDDLLRNADSAMYRAKSKGRAHHEVFDTSMYAHALERLSLEADLRHALERDEFRLYYQPKVALATGRIVGLEALVRWEHPERGLVSPADFIPLAEEIGLILPLGRWVLTEACRQACLWHERYADDSSLTMAVNLSVRQFQHPELVAEVAALLRETGLAPQSLVLEVTESMLVDEVEATIVTLRNLKDLGVRLAIDDFGTGYSSLSYLKRFPVDTLKVDRSFVDGLGCDLEDTAIVQTIVTLAKTLGLHVVAEGVENAEQARQLQALQCEFAQGYYFGKPLPSDEVAILLEQAIAFSKPAPRQQRQRQQPRRSA